MVNNYSSLNNSHEFEYTVIKMPVPLWLSLFVFK